MLDRQVALLVAQLRFHLLHALGALLDGLLHLLDLLLDLGRQLVALLHFFQNGVLVANAGRLHQSLRRDAHARARQLHQHFELLALDRGRVGRFLNHDVNVQT
ncbi:hypothetical protein D9M69_686120 [compost metagenome]